MHFATHHVRRIAVHTTDARNTRLPATEWRKSVAVAFSTAPRGRSVAAGFSPPITCTPTSKSSAAATQIRSSWNLHKSSLPPLLFRRIACVFALCQSPTFGPPKTRKDFCRNRASTCANVHSEMSARCCLLWKTSSRRRAREWLTSINTVSAVPYGIVDASAWARSL
jgi:hypothetical protein